MDKITSLLATIDEHKLEIKDNTYYKMCHILKSLHVKMSSDEFKKYFDGSNDQVNTIDESNDNNDINEHHCTNPNHNHNHNIHTINVDSNTDFAALMQNLLSAINPNMTNVIKNKEDKLTDIEHKAAIDALSDSEKHILKFLYKTDDIEVKSSSLINNVTFKSIFKDLTETQLTTLFIELPELQVLYKIENPDYDIVPYNVESRICSKLYCIRMTILIEKLFKLQIDRTNLTDAEYNTQYFRIKVLLSIFIFQFVIRHGKINEPIYHVYTVLLDRYYIEKHKFIEVLHNNKIDPKFFATHIPILAKIIFE